MRPITVLTIRPLLLTALITTSFCAKADDVVPAQDANKPASKADATKGDAQSGKDDKAKRAGKPDRVKRIEVTAEIRNKDIDERRNSVASKMVFSREELDHYGDSTVGEMLKRLPGVTVSGRPGRGGDIRMRGMGSGYTQILLNGDPVPRGFSMDSLSPDQIERIEIYRAPIAEHSARAIAGTINIILREDFRKKDSQLKLAGGIERGYLSPNLMVQHTDDIGNLNYNLTASIMHGNQANQTVTTTNGVNPLTGSPDLLQIQSDQSRSRSESAHLTPRFTFKFEGGDTLNFQPFLMTSRSDNIGGTVLDTVLFDVKESTPFVTAQSQVGSQTTMARGFGNWQHKSEDGGKLQVRFSYGLSSMDTDTFQVERDASGNPLQTLVDDNDTHEHGLSNGGKYSVPIGIGQTFGAGWDVEYANRTQTREQIQNGVEQTSDYGDNFDSQMHRLAFYAQDEWEFTPRWSAYAGLRWEGIRTQVEWGPSSSITNTSSVWSPLLHTVWKLPDSTKDQVRASITRSYRAPQLGDLNPLPSYTLNNTVNSPDTMGNPNLKPELALGLDAAYEHYFDTGGMMSVSVFNRDIHDLMRSVLTQQYDDPNQPQTARWVTQKMNVGNAVTRGIELEAKFRLEEVMDKAIPLEVRANYSFYRSNVDGVNGAYNRIDQQPSMTANLGLDYRFRSVPLTVGGNWNWTPAYTVDQTSSQIYTQGAKRVLDVYGLWRFNASAQLRLSASNLVNQDYDTSNEVMSELINQTASVVARTYTVWTARLELKF